MAAARPEPPHAHEAELSVLGGLLIDHRAWAEVRALVGAEDFHAPAHQVTFRAMEVLAQAQRPIDGTTLIAALRERGELEDAGGAAYVWELALDTPSAANVRAYARIVRERSALRALIAAGLDIVELGQHPAGRGAGELLAQAEHRLAGLHRADAAAPRALHEVVGTALDTARERARRRALNEDYGASTGLPAVDEALGAFAAGCLYVLAARPGVGKTAFLSQLALHSARRGFPGLICSLEMSETQLGARAAASIARANVTALLRGHADGIAAAELGLAANPQTLRLPLWFDTQTAELPALIARLHQARRNHGIRFAAVDHIGLVRGAGGQSRSRNDEIGEITWALKRAAKRLDIAIVALSQLNRASERDGRRPQLADLRDSGNVEQDADLVMFLHAPAPRGGGDQPREIGLFKNRDGREGWLGTPEDARRFFFNGRTQTFYEAVAREDEA